MNLGAIACKKAMPDLRRLVTEIDAEFADLLALAQQQDTEQGP